MYSNEFLKSYRVFICKWKNYSDAHVTVNVINCLLKLTELIG